MFFDYDQNLKESAAMTTSAMIALIARVSPLVISLPLLHNIADLKANAQLKDPRLEFTEYKPRAAHDPHFIRELALATQ